MAVVRIDRTLVPTDWAPKSAQNLILKFRSRFRVFESELSFKCSQLFMRVRTCRHTPVAGQREKNVCEREFGKFTFVRSRIAIEIDWLFGRQRTKLNHSQIIIKVQLQSIICHAKRSDNWWFWLKLNAIRTGCAFQFASSTEL